MANFDPFSESGKAWLEENNVEDQYETLENVGFCVSAPKANLNTKSSYEAVYEFPNILIGAFV